MTTKEVLEFFGGYKKTAMILKIWPNTIYTWGEKPPKLRQFQIEVLSKGVLKASQPEKPKTEK